MTALTYFPPRGLATLLRFREISDRRSSVFLKGKIEARMLGIEPDNETNLFDIMREFCTIHLQIIWIADGCLLQLTHIKKLRKL